MRNYIVAALMAAAVGSSLQAGFTTVQQIVQSGASGWSYGSGPDGSYNFSVWETTKRGTDGQAQAYTYFSVGRQLGSGTWESISGSGYIPASAVKATGTTLQVEVEDLSLLPDYYLTGMRCDMFSCVPIGIDGPFGVNVVFTKIPGNSEERSGVTRRHTEFDWMSGASVDIVEVGSSSTTWAAASGNLGMFPLQNTYMSGATMGQARGTTITIESNPQ
jgi:hypothetical protein